MVATGLRVGELCRLRVLDVVTDGTSLRVHGKGSRDRVVYITDLDCAQPFSGWHKGGSALEDRMRRYS
uniref:Tyrosine-type recombinase/integrase n=1 Tax=Bradyrhizobium septentrionale TaxID=1404411 RepID=A0A974A6U4_9BRAD